jgi:hypothetical protein
LALVYDEKKVAYLRDFFERRIEFLQEMSTWLERVDASQIQVLPGKIELDVFLEGFRLLVGAMISEFRLIYHILEHLEVGLHFSNAENDFLFSQLTSIVDRPPSPNVTALSDTDKGTRPDNGFSEKAEASLAELWKIAEIKRKEQEEEERISKKRLEGKYSITPLRK